MWGGAKGGRGREGREVAVADPHSLDPQQSAHDEGLWADVQGGGGLGVVGTTLHAPRILTSMPTAVSLLGCGEFVPVSV